jgi:DNA-binding MarR family transcriptional regulator
MTTGQEGRRQHPRLGLDELIHSPVRLSIMATLATAGETDFRFLRETLQISDSLLSKHAAQLEASGYVNVVKGFVGKRSSTWYTLTDEGRAAFERYRRTLAEILGEGGGPDGTSADAPADTPADTSADTSGNPADAPGGPAEKGTSHDA